MPPYKAAWARQVGRSHAATHTPCQDFVSHKSARKFSCMALADGAGSRQHSDVGAELAVNATLLYLRRNFDALYTLALTDERACAERILAYCLKAFERKARTMGWEVRSMGCTLMFVAHNGDRLLAGHVGDGIIAVQDEFGVTSTLSHPDNGEYVNSTVFVTEKGAVQRFTIIAQEDRSTGFAVMSDGVAESLYSRATRQPAQIAMKKIFQWTTSSSKKKGDRILLSNIEQAFAQKSSDDCSIGVMVRRSTASS